MRWQGAVPALIMPPHELGTGERMDEDALHRSPRTAAHALGPLFGGRIAFARLIPFGLCQPALVAWLFAARSANAARTEEAHA